MVHRGVGLLVILLGAVFGPVGCASLSYSSAPIEAVSSECDSLFRQWQQDVVAGNHFDAQARPPPGFPYLRVNRFLASFELSQLSAAQRQEWLQRAHSQAVVARSHEADSLRGGDAGRLAALRQCGQAAMARLQRGGESWHRLEAVALVPDSYRPLAQVVGMYPLVAPLVQQRAKVVMGELRERYRAPYRPVHPQTVYAPPESIGPEDAVRVLARARSRSTLGIPVFSAVESQALFVRYAPTWVLETRDGNDVPGYPGRRGDGKLTFEPAPVVYTHLSYARFNGQVLPQLNYLVWFASRPASGGVDIYAGRLDGFFWRVTLGQDGLPLIYDFVHACGCYHQWLLVESGLVPVNGVSGYEEPLWIAGAVRQANRGMALHLSAGEHHLVAARIAADQVADFVYRLLPYDQLRGRSPAGERLFASDGLVYGSQRLERFLLWPTGVVSAGAMRQWGQHAVAFTGRRHFDDPDLLQRYFLDPAPAPGRPD